MAGNNLVGDIILIETFINGAANEKLISNYLCDLQCGEKRSSRANPIFIYSIYIYIFNSATALFDKFR